MPRAAADLLIGVTYALGLLHRLLRIYWFAKLIGAQGRVKAWRQLGAHIDGQVDIGPAVQIRSPENIFIGGGSRLVGRVFLDGWGEIHIGRNVLMNDQVDILTAQHHLDSPTFQGDIRSVHIGDYAWLPLRIIVLPGVTIGRAAVIGSGSVVSSDVPDYGVAAGNPAKVVKQRARVEYTYVPSQF
jgi:acetyltransferase-like isoleucine patch superfamily enzyme